MQSFLSVTHLPNLEPQVFGCTVYVHVPKFLWSKLDPCMKQCVFVGYSEFQKGYQCYYPQTRKLHVTLDVSFCELKPYYQGEFLGLLFRGRVILKRMKVVEKNYSHWRKMGDLKAVLRK